MKSIASIILTLGLGACLAGAAEGDPKPKQTPAIPEWAKPYDKNGDGVLDAEERRAAMQARRDEMMKKYDKNGDGKLDDEERKAMSQDRLKQREQQGAKPKVEGDKKKDEKKEEKK